MATTKVHLIKYKDIEDLNLKLHDFSKKNLEIVQLLDKVYTGEVRKNKDKIVLNEMPILVRKS